MDSRRGSRDRFDVYVIAPVSTVLAVAVEPRRCRREKLTPRFPMPPARAMTGGLLGQFELASEDFEMEWACTERREGVVCFDELREAAEPRLEFRRAFTRRELPVRW